MICCIYDFSQQNRRGVCRSVGILKCNIFNFLTYGHKSLNNRVGGLSSKIKKPRQNNLSGFYLLNKIIYYKLTASTAFISGIALTIAVSMPPFKVIKLYGQDPQAPIN